MKKRRRLSRGKSRKVFRKGTKTHVKNIQDANVMRGGYRL